MQLTINRFVKILTAFLLLNFIPILHAASFQLDNLNVNDQTVDILYDFTDVGDV